MQVKFREGKLRSECEVQVANVLRDAALDYKLNPLLKSLCQEEVNHFILLDCMLHFYFFSLSILCIQPFWINWNNFNLLKFTTLLQKSFYFYCYPIIIWSQNTCFRNVYVNCITVLSIMLCVCCDTNFMNSTKKPIVFAKLDPQKKK